ncbi:phage major capsid protein [Microbacterium sp. SS28]|uniref:phage major capsid protein n=1 Tax=Microbacterium sp. SS28 TaxID=2919948 RepID=UPI001FAA8130|nr:phage major capsid protein [Microbacterium sp. SS28]
MSNIEDALEQRRQGLITEATKIAQKGVAENRSLSGEEQSKFDGMIAEAEKLQERVHELHEGAQRAQEWQRSWEQSTGRQYRSTVQDGAFGKWARESRSGDTYDLAPVAGAERRAVAAYRSGQVEERAMSATGGVGADGVYGTLWEYAVAGSQILQAGCTIISTADGNTLPLPVATVHSTAATAAANAALTSSDATITTVNLTTTKYQYITLVPNELLQDVTFDIEGYLARAAGRELGKNIANVAGTAAVAGFTTSGATVANASIATGLADAVIDLYHSVLPEYRTTAAALANDDTLLRLRKAKTTGSGDYVWQNSLTSERPDTLLGKGVYVHPALDSAGAASRKIMYFGDWSALAVRIAGGIRFERSTDYAFGNDQTAFRAIVRTGSVVVDPNAVKYLVTT